MEAAVKSRPNHYETLGLAPTAASHEIVTAFAWQSSAFRPHAFGGMAEVCMAYATLRDPIKRQAYDASIGLTPEPQPPAPQADPKPRSKPFVHPALGRIGAAAPRKPVDPAPFDRSPAPPMALRHRPEAETKPRPEPIYISTRPPYAALENPLGADARDVDWKRTGMMLGGVVVAACLLGGLAGWWSASDIDETQQEPSAVAAPLPSAKPWDRSATLPPTPAFTEIDAQPERSRRAVAARPERTVVRPVVNTDPPPQESPDQPSELLSNASEQIDELAPVASNVTASMPLPNKVVARTIERIGYSCGAVASTSPVEGRAGVYNVNCTSGQSYQAKPVNGRYRFKRLGRQ